MQNPFQIILRFQFFFKFFFEKLIFFTVLTPYNALVRKVDPAKNHFLVLFYSANSISDHFTILELFQVFFRKISIFHCFDPDTAKVRNMKSGKKRFSVLFYSAKSISDHFTISNFSSFSRNYFFLLLRPPILHT